MPRVARRDGAPGAASGQRDASLRAVASLELRIIHLHMYDA
jgi:hypothetical protein